jgi:predicted branched-subunit amino acid permease
MAASLDRPDPVRGRGGVRPAAGAVRRIDRDALRDVWPALLGLAPFGLVVGVTIAQSRFGPALGLGSAALFFGGTAHLAALTLLTAGAGPAAVLATVVVVNSRLALYGAALQPHFRSQPAWFRWLAPHLMIDQTYAIAAARPELAEPADFRRYWLTAGVAAEVVWLAGHAAGLLLGPVLSRDSPLQIAAPAVLVGLLAPQLRRRPAAVAAAVVTAAAASVLPRGVGLVVGVVAGLLAAALVDRSPTETEE